MKKPKPSPITCVVRARAGSRVRRAGIVGEVKALERCSPIEPLGRLLALGLTPEDIGELDIRRPMLESICEQIQPEDTNRTPAENALDAAKAMLEVIAEQTQSIDLELRMLSIRKKALKRRSGILERLAQSLGNASSEREAA